MLLLSMLWLQAILLRGYFAENTVGAGVVNTDVAHAFDVPTVAVAFKIPDPRSKQKISFKNA